MAGFAASGRVVSLPASSLLLRQLQHLFAFTRRATRLASVTVPHSLQSGASL